MRGVAQGGYRKPCENTADPAAQNELARLRRDAAQRAAAAAQHQRAAASVAQATSHSAAPTPSANGAAPPPAASEQLLRSLKVSWYLKVSTRSTRGLAATCVCCCAFPPQASTRAWPARDTVVRYILCTRRAACMSPLSSGKPAMQRAMTGDASDRRCQCSSLSSQYLRVQDGSYSSDQLRAILGAHGPVEDVVLLEQKKKSKASAVVVMATAAGAAAAAASRNGNPDNTLLVVPFLKVCV